MPPVLNLFSHRCSFMPFYPLPWLGVQKPSATYFSLVIIREINIIIWLWKIWHHRITRVQHGSSSAVLSASLWRVFLFCLVSGSHLIFLGPGISQRQIILRLFRLLLEFGILFQLIPVGEAILLPTSGISRSCSVEVLMTSKTTMDISLYPFPSHTKEEWSKPKHWTD